jgi:hypothetical protein
MQMKRLAPLLIGVCLFMAAGTGVMAQETGPFSVGVILGEPTGISGKAWIGQLSAIDLALAWSFVAEGRIYVHADYQQYFDFGQPDAGRLLFYGGIGGKLYVGADVELGVRLPLGVLYEIEQIPLEVFLEVAPGISIFPATALDFGGGLGVRYRFE